MNPTMGLVVECGSPLNIGIFFMHSDEGYYAILVTFMAGIYVVNMLLGP